jgi:hypothetical protein
MAVSSILSDELLSELMAVGQVDVVVGLPTLNHSDSVGDVVRAVHLAFNRELARERTVLLNVDGGSTDGTPDIVHDASIVERETLLASHSLRTRHRISAPYHGVPGKAAALAVVLAGADLLQARAIVVLDPEIASVSAGSVAALARPALDGADFVSPVYSRHPLEGLLVTQVVRPLFRAAYGMGLQEPLAGEFGCSGRFASRCLEAPEWGSDELRAAIDLWLSGLAATAGLAVHEVALGARRLTPRPRPSITALVPQVLDALFTCFRLQESQWTGRLASGRFSPAAAPAVSEAPPAIDAAGYGQLFREGLAALGDLLGRALRPATYEAVRLAAAAEGLPVVADELWAAVLLDLAAAHRRAAISRDHLLQAAVPLYLGRSASFAAEVSPLGGEPAAERLEALCRRLERSREDLVALWTESAR